LAHSSTSGEGDTVAVLVDRELELGSGSQFLTAARAAGAALIVDGPAGIGKSALLRALADGARQDGFEVLSCGGLEGEEQLDYASLSELIAPLVDAGSPGLPAPQRAAIEIALARVEPGEMTPDRLAVSLACARLLEVASRFAPLLVIVDDEQWLDGATREVLRLALRGTRTHPVGWLIGLRSDEPGPAPLDAERALPAEAVMRVRPGPLGRDATSRLVSDRVAGRWSPATVEQIHAASAGNPLTAIEIARELRRRAPPGAPATAPLPLPASLADALRARVASLSDQARGACEAAAILPRASYDVVALLVGDGAATALAEAESAELLVREPGTLTFAHPLLRLAIDEGLTRPRRADLHLRAAAIVRDPVEQALHLALGHIDPQGEVAGRAAGAAVTARERNATGVALALLEHALRLTPTDDDEARDTRRADLAEALLGAGEYDRAATLLEAWLGDTARGSARARLLVSRQALEIDRTLEDAFLREALDNAASDPQLRAWIELSIAMATGLERNSGRGIEHASRSREIAAEIGDGELEATTLALLGMFTSVAGQTGGDALVEDAVRRAPDPTSRYDMYLQPRMAAGLVALWAGRLDAAATHLETLARAFERWGVAQYSAFIALHLAELRWRTGEWDRGAVNADAMWRFDAETGGSEPGARDYALGLLLAARGDDAAARLAAERGLRASEAIGDRIFALQNRVVLGFVESSLGDHGAVLRWLDPVPAELEDLGVRNPGCYPFAPDMLEALVAAGRIDDAARLVAWLDHATRAGDHPWARCIAERGRGLILLARGDHDEAVAQLELALGAHDELPVPHERARALLLLGGAQRRARRRSDAAATLELAIGAFQALGSSNFEARAHDERRRLGLRGEQDELTATELLVARLVADGLTNKEVASSLFMSTKTVEANLTRIYRTLGLRSRSELARHLSRAEG
jgi:DNA-binding CsgD family transcriptional regulator